MALPEFLPAAPGLYAHSISPQTGEVRHHLVLGFHKQDPVTYPPIPKGYAFACYVSPHMLYCPQTDREHGGINDVVDALGAQR